MKKLFAALLAALCLLTSCSTIGGSFYGNNNGAVIGLGSGFAF